MNDLGSYISNVLTEIVSGVVDAQVNVNHLNAQIIPVGLSVVENGEQLILKALDGNIASFVEFDISLVVESKSSGEAGFKLSILKIGANAKVAGEDKKANSHKVKFKVPILFPAHKNI
jgi:hypothetical protein